MCIRDSLYIAPFFALFALVGLFPLLYTGWVALNKWSLVTGNQGFLGMGNFSYVLAQPRFWDAVVNTFSIFLLSSVPQILLAIAIASVLDANLRANRTVAGPQQTAPLAIQMCIRDRRWHLLCPTWPKSSTPRPQTCNGLSAPT